LCVTSSRDVYARRRLVLSHVSGVSERESTRLRPHAQAVWLPPHLDAVRQLARLSIAHVHLFVVATRHPKLLPVGAHVPHVGTPAPPNRPRRHSTTPSRLAPAAGPGPVASAGGRVPAVDRDVHKAAVAARVDP